MLSGHFKIVIFVTVDVNSSCVLLAELHVNLLLVSANLQIILIGYQNIGRIPYWCITNDIDFN